MRKLFFFAIMALSVTLLSAQQDKKEVDMPRKHNVNRLSENYFIPERFQGKSILITGGARGIGKWTAIRAAKEGADVVIMDWLEEDGRHVADSLSRLGLNSKGRGVPKGGGRDGQSLRQIGLCLLECRGDGRCVFRDSF